jgi:DNA-binding GntR family transcriptional regulator
LGKSVSCVRQSRQATFSPLLVPRQAPANPATTLSERVYRAFKRDIIHGVFQLGEAVTEKELAARYKGSRTPIREAAVRLQNERLVRIVPNRGYFVSQITLQNLNDIYEFRCAVECSAAELAARKGGDPETLKEIAELSLVACRMEDRESCIRFVESDTAFHIAIARLSRNQMLIQAVSDARGQMERIMYAAIDIDYYGEEPGKEHREILRAIQDRDPERARREMHSHIMQSMDKVLGLTGASGYRR